METLNYYEPKVPFYSAFSEYPPENLAFCFNSKDKIDTGYENEFGIEIYQDSKHNKLLYNKIYYSANKSPYIVLSSYNNEGLMLKIQFVNTRTVAAIRFSEFANTNSAINTVDLYELTMFDGNGCLGNIIYEPLGREEPYLNMLDGPRYYEVWCDMMSRCFIPQSQFYLSYGAVGLQPFYYTWRCFKYFYIDMEKAFHTFRIDFDASNPMLYSVGPRVTNMHYIMTAKMFPTMFDPYKRRGKRPNDKSINMWNQKHKLYSVVGPCKD